jgi:hypothetical protein
MAARSPSNTSTTPCKMPRSPGSVRDRYCSVHCHQVHAAASRPTLTGLACLLRNHTAHIAAIDLFIVSTNGFKLLYGLVILRLERRRLAWTDVTANPTADWIARQITEAFPFEHRLRCRGHAPIASHGYSRPTDHASVALAERSC